MSGPATERADGDGAAELFEEYLDKWVDGVAPPIEELAQRAGPHAAELREKVKLLADFTDLAQLLEDEPEAAAPALERVAHFAVLHKIDESRFSRVYRARDEKLGRDVALKVLRSDALGAGEASAWVRKEGRSLAQLEHPSIVRVYEADVVDGIAYLAMEHVDGPSLFDVIAALRAREAGEDPSALRPTALVAADELASLAKRCGIALALARALGACHQIGIVHRDVKPGNVLLDRAHTPKLIDFGLAHHDEGEASLHHTQNLYGTLPYLAPEQVERHSTGASPASDQYALGLVLYELVTLRHPFVREGMADTWRAVARAEIVPPRAIRRDVPVDLERICLHCLERDPAKRYASMNALASDLDAFLDHRAISLPEPALWPRVWKTLLRNKARAAGVAAGVLVLTGFAFSLLLGRAARRSMLDGVRSSFAAAQASLEPAGFAEFFADAWSARDAAQGYDRALLAGSLLPEIGTELERMYAEASSSLHEILAQEYERIEPSTIGDRGADERAQQLRETWIQATSLESLAAPTGKCDLPGHAVGTVVLPPGAKLLRYSEDGPPAFPLLEEVPAGDVLLEGLYRCVFGGPSGAIELDFVGSPFQPQRELRPAAIPLALYQRSVRSEARLIELSSDGSQAKYAVGPIQILDGPITLQDIELGLGAIAATAARSLSGIYGGVPSEQIPMSAPALINWIDAMRCASKLGARLPTPAELWTALRAGDVEPVPNMTSEWVSAYWSGDAVHVFRLEYDGSLAADATEPLLLETDRTSPKHGNCFRLVFPVLD